MRRLLSWSRGACLWPSECNNQLLPCPYLPYKLAHRAPFFYLLSDDVAPLVLISKYPVFRAFAQCFLAFSDLWRVRIETFTMQDALDYANLEWGHQSSTLQCTDWSFHCRDWFISVVWVWDVPPHTHTQWAHVFEHLVPGWWPWLQEAMKPLGDRAWLMEVAQQKQAPSPDTATAMDDSVFSTPQ